MCNRSWIITQWRSYRGAGGAPAPAALRRTYVYLSNFNFFNYLVINTTKYFYLFSIYFSNFFKFFHFSHSFRTQERKNVGMKFREWVWLKHDKRMRLKIRTKTDKVKNRRQRDRDRESWAWVTWNELYGTARPSHNWA